MVHLLGKALGLEQERLALVKLRRMQEKEVSAPLGSPCAIHCLHFSAMQKLGLGSPDVASLEAWNT